MTKITSSIYADLIDESDTKALEGVKLMAPQFEAIGVLRGFEMEVEFGQQDGRVWMTFTTGIEKAHLLQLFMAKLHEEQPEWNFV